MSTPALQAKMWADLLNTALDARSATHRVTSRAEIYMAAGLPLEKILDALSISRATWYRRVESLREWETTNQAALPATPTTITIPAASTPTTSATTVEVDLGSASSRGRAPETSWLVRLRRADRSVIVAIGLRRPAADSLAENLAALLAAGQDPGSTGR